VPNVVQLDPSQIAAIIIAFSKKVLVDTSIKLYSMHLVLFDIVKFGCNIKCPFDSPALLVTHMKNARRWLLLL